MDVKIKYALDTVLFYLEGSAVFKGTVTGITVDYSKDSTIINYRLSTLLGMQIREESRLSTEITNFIDEM
jgi:hypothetical protein